MTYVVKSGGDSDLEKESSFSSNETSRGRMNVMLDPKERRKIHLLAMKR